MDLFHATGLKNHKASFDATYNAIEFSVNQIKNSYNEKWNELNEIRKKWAAIQEKIIFIVKSNGLKFSKSLDKCTNEEMIVEIERLANLIPEERMTFKKYEDDLILYYKKILRLAEELETLSKKINLMNPQEIDKDEELIIDLDNYRKNRNQTNNSMEVISIYPATEDIIKSKNKLFKKNEVEEVPFIEVNNLLVTGSVVEKTHQQEEPFLEYEIKGNMTLVDIAESVYGNGAYWRLLYLYSTNKEKIDSIAERFNVDPEVISTIKGFLDGVKLRFPLELFDLNEITERKLA